jgi:hypothetical protein
MNRHRQHRSACLKGAKLRPHARLLKLSESVQILLNLSLLQADGCRKLRLTARAKAVYAKRLESTERALTQQDSTDSAAEDTPRRFHVELFIKHPAMDPADISAALGLEAHSAQRVGDPRTTPKGTPVSGNYWDTRWRHCVECSVADQWYAAEVTRLLDRLEPHKAFFANLKSTGGNACVIIQFFSDGYLSDEIPHATLAKLVELGLDLGIECFVD